MTEALNPLTSRCRAFFRVPADNSHIVTSVYQGIILSSDIAVVSRIFAFAQRIKIESCWTRVSESPNQKRE